MLDKESGVNCIGCPVTEWMDPFSKMHPEKSVALEGIAVIECAPPEQRAARCIRLPAVAAGCDATAFKAACCFGTSSCNAARSNSCTSLGTCCSHVALTGMGTNRCLLRRQCRPCLLPAGWGVQQHQNVQIFRRNCDRRASADSLNRTSFSKQLCRFTSHSRPSLGPARKQPDL